MKTQNKAALVLDIVIPVYNEQAVLEKSITTLREYLSHALSL